jgi:CubicO group peptidase (beta-lactamase class C family)
MNNVRLKHVVDLCESWVEQGIHKALCVLVARRGVICLHEAFGRLRPHSDAPVELDSIFSAQSITKPITATALMMLVEDGLVGLTRPVQEYVPEFRGEDKDQVLVHHLLTHTSGIADDNVIAEYVQERENAELLPPEDTQHPAINKWPLLSGDGLRIGVSAPLSKSPGEEMVYSNLGYLLVGEIVRTVSGRSLAEFAASRIFVPLGMNDTSYVLPDEHYPRTMGWYLLRPEVVDTTSREFREMPHAGGGVHSTPTDLAVFGQMFLNGGSYGDTRILGRTTVAEMTRDQIPGIGATIVAGDYREHHAEASWGYGWAVAGNEKWSNWPTFTRGTISHSGAGAMMLWVDPVNEIVGVYLSVCRMNPATAGAASNIDLFVNAVTAAVEV